MTLSDQIEFPPSAVRFPGRHEVVAAVLRQEGREIPVVVKKARLSIAQRYLGTMAERSVAIALAMRERNISTPEPLGFELRRGESWLVVREVPDAIQIRSWFLNRDDPSLPLPALPAPFESVVRALGALARSMHDAGVFFRDFSDGNILVSPDGEGIRLWLVDVSRARIRSGPVSFWNRLRDLARPGLNRPEDHKLLLQSYFRVETPPWLAILGVRLLRARIVFWDDLKRRLRPWRN